MSRPPTRTLPPESRQPVRVYPISVSAIVVLPDPLSPISATISPGAMSRLTPLMISTRRPESVVASTFRSRISTRFSI